MAVGALADARPNGILDDPEAYRTDVRVAVVSPDTTLVRALSAAARVRRLAISAWTAATLPGATPAPHVVAFDAASYPLDALAGYRRRFSDTRWLVLGSTEPRLVVQGFAAGADAWIPRTEPPRRIVLAIELLAEGIACVSHRELQLLLSLAGIDEDRERHLANTFGLSPRQLEVLTMAARGLTDHEIADRLVLSVRTVNRHMSDILSVLRCSNRHEASRVLLADAAPANGIAAMTQRIDVRTSPDHPPGSPG